MCCVINSASKPQILGSLGLTLLMDVVCQALQMGEGEDRSSMAN